jgi:outer membrane protein OmpA-like peptidoglycan-associated protein
MQPLRLICATVFWWVSAFDLASLAQNMPERDSAVFISGSCWDITTGVDLRVKASALVNGKLVYVGESDEAGKFNLSIPRSTAAITFESKGFRTITTPVSIQGKTKKTDQFKVSFRMIPIDSQQVVNAYPSISTGAIASEGSTQDAIPTHFKVRDVYLRKLLTSKICLKFNSGSTFCFNTDSLKAPIATFVGALENIEITVSSEGFQPYTGKLKSKNINGVAIYSIQLLRESNSLSLLFNVPGGQQAEFLFYKNGPFSSFKAKNGQMMLFDSYNRINTLGHVQVAVVNNQNETTGEDYGNFAQLLDSRKKAGSKVILEDGFTISTGLTLKAFHIENSSAFISEPVLDDVAVTEPVSTGNLTLYFDQSNYLLGKQTKITLDSIAEILLNSPTLSVKLTGHTDNVGRRELNLRLSEYRGRVTAHYLLKKGVLQNQIEFDWQGPDAPRVSNDSEENRMKNRRVELSLVKNIHQ